MTNVHEKFQQKRCQKSGLPKDPWIIADKNQQNGGLPISRKFGSPKDPWTLAHENRQNGGFTYYEVHFTLKIGRFSHRDQPSP
ncbi:hypothetical protein H5410_056553 [Solanum commersonii]|uniref:Uncharacterized protein n=1 Tax=Solanum commersonii TaxID=4109 RepID=A0A9J5WKK3_SOLCO|nr:hypothetical protein H5410_056553 [Solanum commersonii]